MGSMATRMGFKSGDLLLEVGFRDDCDRALRAELVSLTGNELLDGDVQEVVDGVILWWREDDGDLRRRRPGL